MCMVAKLSRNFGYICIHDPGSGIWYVIANDDAPPWVKWKARKRKELYRAGDRAAYRPSAEQMQDIWDDEHTQEEGPSSTTPTQLHRR
jgi:hypothetical protein